MLQHLRLKKNKSSVPLKWAIMSDFFGPVYRSRSTYIPFQPYQNGRLKETNPYWTIWTTATPFWTWKHVNMSIENNWKTFDAARSFYPSVFCPSQAKRKWDIMRRTSRIDCVPCFPSSIFQEPLTKKDCNFWHHLHNHIGSCCKKTPLQ